MERLTLAVSLGLLSILLMPTLPNIWIALAMLLLGCLLFKTLTTTASFVIGISICILSVNLHFKDLKYLLPANSTIKGVIVSLPEQGKHGNRFYFKLSKIIQHQSVRESHSTLLMMWPGKHSLEQGQQWIFDIKAKPISGLFNQGVFNYQRYLLAKGVIAKGTVINATPVELSADTRGVMAKQLAHHLSEFSSSRFIYALIIGDKRQFYHSDWHIMKTTGTSHLFAISGLHLGLVALFVCMIVKTILGLLVTHIWLTRWVTFLVTMISAIFYSYLAGFSEPTLRALIMLIVSGLLLVMRQRNRPFQILGLAFLTIAISSPLSLLSQGLWLSVLALATVFLVISHVDPCDKKNVSVFGLVKHWIVKLFTLQLGLAIGLYFIQILFFGGISLIAPVANLIAVPLVSLVILPLLFAASVLLIVFDETLLSYYLFDMADWVLSRLFIGLEYLSTIKGIWLDSGTTVVGMVVVTAIFYKIACVMSSLSWRYYCALLILPVCIATVVFVQARNEDHWRIDFLDVGHGNSAIISKGKRAIIIDTGKAFDEQSSMASTVIIPWLVNHQLAKVDYLLITHQDNDHAAGKDYLTKAFSNVQVIDNNHHLCNGGSIRWQGLDIKFIKAKGLLKKSDLSENNRSCLMRISNVNASVLLTGDIEHSAEKQLIKQLDKSWQSTVMQVPHHGSKTSSSKAFISLISPQIAVVSAGAFNHWHFPAPLVQARYAAIKTTLLTTGIHGQITIEFSDQRPHIITYREHRSPFWYNDDLSFGHYQR